jgi:UDP-N-acetylglucosamine diphosphorylase / glucose-1-phosphate thymidylyltransferase / UDP-N-acetylgalactosamine diphosphorylase / glucosamine-1-phosphate N-acetyltransferase / galactosamine-1-phosphate N-acetyltransferase
MARKPGLSHDQVSAMLQPTDFFDLSEASNAILFEGCDLVWEALPKIGDHVARLVGEGQTIHGEVMAGAYLSGRPLYIAEGARIEPGAYVQGPAYIGPGAVVRHGAFVRENVILLAGAVLGHASEAKNSLFLPQAQAPHFNYVGDSILGRRVNLGAGTKLSNLALSSEKDRATGRRPSIKIHIEGVEYNTGLAKFGAILGDEAQTGCNAVLNPGCLVGRHTLVYANLSLPKGYYLPHSVVKLRQEMQTVPRF